MGRIIGLKDKKRTDILKYALLHSNGYGTIDMLFDWEYDDQGRLIKRTHKATGQSQQWIYNDKGLLVKFIDSNGFEQCYKYDENDKVIYYKDTYGTEYVNIFDTEGNFVKRIYSDEFIN